MVFSFSFYEINFCYLMLLFNLLQNSVWKDVHFQERAGDFVTYDLVFSPELISNSKFWSKVRK